MGKYLNLKGKRFGKLTAQYRVEDGVRGYAKWLCQCDCGNQKVCTAQQLKAGHVRRTDRRGQPPEMWFVMREDPSEPRALLPETLPLVFLLAYSTC